MELNLLLDGVSCNPGPWGRHCLTAAYCAEKIAGACGNMDTEKVYILGLLHDIGRKFGVRHAVSFRGIRFSDKFAYKMCEIQSTGGKLPTRLSELFEQISYFKSQSYQISGNHV